MLIKNIFDFTVSFGNRKTLASFSFKQPVNLKLRPKFDLRQYAGLGLQWIKIRASGAWRYPLFRGRWRLPSWQTLHSVFA